jgi:hypothetical protein
LFLSDQKNLFYDKPCLYGVYFIKLKRMIMQYF